MVIGITGNFGVGKTTAANMFRQLGAKVIDVDRIAHRLLQRQGSTYKQIVACFGKEILSGRRHSISRKKLARVVFNNSWALKKLNAIMHPKILRIINRRIKNSSDNEILVIDAALLIELGLLHRIDKLVLVKSEPKIQMQRLRKSGLTVDEIEKRVSAQLSQDEKMNFADFIIDNSGLRNQTKKQAVRIWNEISEAQTYGTE